MVSERAGRPDEAEAFYRRATAIAAAALPADDPMVVTSRKNLEDFCRMRGLSMDAPGPATDPPHKATEGLDAFVSEHVIDEFEMPAVANREAASAPLTAPELSPVPAAAVDEFTAAAAPPEPSRPRRGSHSLAWATTGVAALAAVVLLSVRPWSSPETISTVEPPRPPTTAESASPPPVESVATPAPAEPARPEKSTPSTGTGTAGRTSDAAATTGNLALPIAQMCRTLSTAGGQWRCVPVAEPIAPGPIVLYTRVQSARDATIFHRWYRGDTLRQSVKLSIRANAREGYRTYSRQTVDRGAEWRVEVTDADGHLLHERRIAVQ